MVCDADPTADGVVLDLDSSAFEWSPIHALARSATSGYKGCRFGEYRRQWPAQGG